MTDTQVEETRLPTYSIPKIVHARDRMADALTSRYAEIAISTQSDLDLFLDDLMPYLSGQVSRSTMFETFRPFMGAPYPATWWRDFFWRIAANLDSLGAGYPLRPWQPPGTQEWVPVQIMRVDPAPHKKQDSRYGLQLRVLAGQACPLIFSKQVSGNWLKQLSRFVGFTRLADGRPYMSPYQFAGLRTFVLLLPEHSRDGRPGFYDVRCSGSSLDHNRDVLNRRYRRKHKFECPHAFEHDCHQCAIGYLECPAGTHKENYVEKPCLGCGQPAWFDPEVKTELCVNCWRKQVAKSS